MSSVSRESDIIRRKNLVVASLIGAGIITVVLGSFGGVVWLLAG
jgi:hypothetical protein